MTPPTEPTIMIRLYGAGVVPERVSVRLMADLVQAIQSLSGTKLHLMKVRRRSAGYLLSAEDDAYALQSLRTSGLALQDPHQHLQTSMLRAFDNITKILSRLKCHLEVRSLVDDFRWTLNQKQWPSIRQRAIITDEASMIGTLQRVGGATERKCGITVEGQSRMKICYLRDDELARRLGRHLYTELAFRGRGQFFTRDWSLIRFTVYEFSIFKRRSFDRMYREIREASGNAWDEVADPRRELEDMR